VPEAYSLEPWHLPDLDSFHYGPIETTESSDASVLSSDVSEAQNDDDDNVDIWALALDLPTTTPKFLTWEAFEAGESDGASAKSAYISEWGPEAFDAALRSVYAKNKSPGQTLAGVAKRDVAIRAFWDLGLGRASVLFCFDERKRVFVPTMERFVVTGYTQATCESLFHDLAGTGSTIRRLKHFAEKTYAANAFPGRVALANAIFVALGSFELYLGSCWSGIQSVLQVQNAFERPQTLINHLKQLVKSLSRCKTDEQISSAMFEYCQSVEDGEDWLRSVMFEMLALISRPLMDRVGNWTGLCFTSTAWDPSHAQLAFIKASPAENEESVQFTLDDASLPSFLTAEAGRSLFDTG
jgi:Gamma tubulin complex component N-terminal/Gamma-tubulin complex component 6 N-terminus